MADNRRAGERTIFRGNVEVDDTLAEISQALEKERRTPIAAVDAGFVPPAVRPASNIPAMADLEEELLREFALYEGPDEVRAPARRVEPTFASPAQPASPIPSPSPARPPVEAAAAPEPVSDDDDDTMPPVDMAPLYRAASAPPVVTEFVPKTRVEPEPPSVFEAESDSAMDFAPEALQARAVAEPVDAGSHRAAAAEPHFAFDLAEPALGEHPADEAEDFDVVDAEPVFAGPVPDLFEGDAEAEAVSLDAGHALEAVESDPVFDGPVPDFDFNDDAAFEGPVPEIDLDDEPVFAGPVPDFDFSASDDVETADAQSLDDELAGELELSVGALDLAPETRAAPVSPFAAWKNDRLSAPIAGDAIPQPVWHSTPAVSLGSIPEADDVATVAPIVAAAPSETASPVETAEASEDALTALAEPETLEAPEAFEAPEASEAPEAFEVPKAFEAMDALDETEAFEAPETSYQADVEPDAAIDFDIELDAADLLEPEEPVMATAEALPEPEAPEIKAFDPFAPVEASSLADDESREQAGDEAHPDAYVEPVSRTTMPQRDEPPILARSVVTPALPAAAAVAAVAATRTDPVLDLPDWLQPSRRPPQPEAAVPAAATPAAAASDDDDLFKDFEFNFDDDAIEAEVSRAVMSELQDVAVEPAPAVIEEPPFDPSQITEIEERIPTALAKLDVPQVPEQEGDVIPEQVSDFDYDIEAEMAELFAMGNKSKALSGAPEPAAGSAGGAEGEADPFDQGFANEIIRSIHETPAIPAGRAFDLAQTNGASTSFVARYAKLAAGAALIAFAGVAALMLWRSGDVPGLATDGAPRVIMADKAPIKEVPENPGGKQVPNQDKAVYDRVAGKSADTVKQGSLIATSEEPVNVAEKTLGSDPGSVDQAQVPGVSEDASDARLPASPSQPGASEQSNEAVAPRKVKTMIVLPNGTLVARETPAPDNAKPDAMVPNPAEATTLAAPGSATQQPGVTAPADASTAQPGDATALAGAPAVNAAEQAPQIAAPVPVPRPAEQPVNVVGTVTQRGNVVSPEAQPATKVASAATKPAAAPAAAASNVPAGSYVIQIASLPSQEEAQKSYSNLSNKFASVIGGRSVDIKPAEIAGKGTYYRVRIVAGSRDDAIALCTRYKAAGGSCLVSR